MNSEEMTENNGSGSDENPTEDNTTTDTTQPETSQPDQPADHTGTDGGADNSDEPSAGTDDTTDAENEDESGDSTEGLRHKLDHMIKARRKTNTENQTLRSRLKHAEQQLNAYKVAAELNVPPEFASRLNGDTVEELKEDAKKLLGSLSRFGYVTDLGSGINFPESESDDTNPLSPKALDDIGARMYRR